MIDLLLKPIVGYMAFPASVVGLIGFLEAPACAEEVPFGTPDIEIIFVAPSLGPENIPLDSKIIRDFMQESSLRYAVYPAPVSRLASMIDELPACSSPSNKGFASFNNYVWVGPVIDAHPSVFARDGLDHPISRLEDLAGFRVGARQAGLAAMTLKQAGINPEEVTSERLNLNKLRAGRLDYWVAREEYVNLVAEAENVNVPKKVLALPIDPLGLSCSHKITPEILDRLRNRANIFYSSPKPMLKSIEAR
jgi:hypothetical protein